MNGFAKPKVRLAIHLLIVLFLTALTQLGGIAWAVALTFRRQKLAFLVIYAALSFGAMATAPLLGRVHLSCWTESPLQVQSWFYCLTNRNYVSPELKTVTEDLANHVADRHPGTVTVALDGSFPFFDGFPLLPHLSHDDGRKLDIAFYYEERGQYLPGKSRSPIGYFAFEQGPTDCPSRWPTMRWDLNWLQPIFPEYDLDPLRLKTAMEWLIGDPRVGKVFLEPHLVHALDLSDPKLRFQGCRAARHDDHIHFQL